MSNDSSRTEDRSPNRATAGGTGGYARRPRSPASSALIFHKVGLFWLFLDFINHLITFRAIELNLIRNLEL
jgi:hypothetical protein